MLKDVLQICQGHSALDINHSMCSVLHMNINEHFLIYLLELRESLRRHY